MSQSALSLCSYLLLLHFNVAYIQKILIDINLNKPSAFSGSGQLWKLDSCVADRTPELKSF